VVAGDRFEGSSLLTNDATHGRFHPANEPMYSFPRKHHLELLSGSSGLRFWSLSHLAAALKEGFKFGAPRASLTKVSSSWLRMNHGRQKSFMWRSSSRWTALERVPLCPTYFTKKYPSPISRAEKPSSLESKGVFDCISETHPMLAIDRTPKKIFRRCPFMS
jgi:hypothetical protein